MVLLQENKQTRQITVTLPKAIAVAKSWKAGTRVLFKIDKEGNLNLVEA